MQKKGKADITSKIFAAILKGFGARVGCAGRVALLFVNKFAAHPPDTPFLRSDSLRFLQVATACCSLLTKV
jgi:hypothetical protein